jgi:hypothetical protein
LRKRHHLNVDVRKKDFVFAKCSLCESLKDLVSKLGRNSSDAREYELKLKKRLLHQELCRRLYHTWRSQFVQSKEEFLCFIHDKIDHAKTTPKVTSGEKNDLWAWTITHYVDGYDNPWSWQ